MPRAALGLNDFRPVRVGEPTFVPSVTYSGALKVDIQKPAISGRPCLIVLHGGGWTSGSRSLIPYPELAAYLSERGFAVFNADYTLGSGSPQTPIDDVKTLVQWVRDNASTYNGDGTRVAILGLSAGAHLGVMAGIQGTKGADRPDAVVGWSTPGDLEEAYSQGNGPAVLGVGGYIGVALTGNEATYRLYSPIDQMSANCCPLRLVACSAEATGVGDPGLAVVQTNSLYTAAQAVNVAVTKRIITGTVHSIFFTGINALLAPNPNFNGWAADDLGATCAWLETAGMMQRPAPSRALATRAPGGRAAVISSTPDAVYTGGGANEPGGYTRIFEHGWSTLQTTNGAWDADTAGRVTTDGNGQYISQTNDTAAPVTPPKTLAVIYPSGLAIGNAPCNLVAWDADFNAAGTEFSKMYIRFYVKFLGNGVDYQAYGGTNKLFFIGYGLAQGGSNVPNQGIIKTVPFDGSGLIRNVTGLQWYFAQQGTVDRDSIPTTGLVPCGANAAWQQHEVLFEVNSGADVADGVLTWYLNGVQTLNQTDMVWKTAGNTTGFWRVTLNPTFGGTGSGEKTRNDFVLIDHLYISGLVA